jgi:hypothetical protein
LRFTVELLALLVIVAVQHGTFAHVAKGYSTTTVPATVRDELREAPTITHLSATAKIAGIAGHLTADSTFEADAQMISGAGR